MLANSLVLRDKLFSRCSAARATQSWDSLNSCANSHRTKASSECSGTNRISKPPTVSKTPSTPLMNIESSKSRCKPVPLLVFVIRRSGRTVRYWLWLTSGGSNIRDQSRWTLLRKLELVCDRVIFAFPDQVILVACLEDVAAPV